MRHQSRRLATVAASAAVLGATLVVATGGPAYAAPACEVSYTVRSQWQNGFTAAVVVRNTGDPVNGWTLTFSFPAAQRVEHGWSASWAQPPGSSQVSAANLDWNANLATGAATEIGFNGSHTGTNPAPTDFALNGTRCGGPNQPPAVNLTSPAPNAQFTAPADIALAATAGDPDGTVALVEFYHDGLIIGSDTTAPYGVTWTGVPAGSYRLRARVVDNLGASALSAEVPVTVNPFTGPRVVAAPTAVVVPEGGTAPVQVQLSAAPAANVTVTVTRTAGDTDLTASPATLTFTPTSYATPQPVTLRAAEDADQTSGQATFSFTAPGHQAATVTASESDNDQPVYVARFLEQYSKLKNSGYFHPSSGVPYHSIETLMVEAPDHGHQTTSEAFSFWLWLEAHYGRVTGNWAPFNTAWTTMERYIIPSQAEQPSNANYNPASPATYAPEWDQPSQYPTPLDAGVTVGQDPLAAELRTTHGTPNIYGMHWLLDVDNVYGYGRCGDGAPGPALINTYQRGPQESVWETVPHPSCERFRNGGPNGYLPLFVQDAAYARQWRYTNAPDADARAIQAAYWALVWATEQGRAADIAGSVANAAKMGDYLRYAFFDKYFKRPGCTAPTCPAGTGKDSAHYLLSWYYSWGGALEASWAWRIGSSPSHFGYQNPMAAWALVNVPALRPRSPSAVADWTTSLRRQLEFYRWLQSAEGAIAGGATNSWAGRYATPPAGLPTFYGMPYDYRPVFHDPPSNQWFGFQAWSMQRVAELLFVNDDAALDALARPVLDKWVTWALAQTTVNPAAGTFLIPSDMSWAGNPDTWNPASPGPNNGLHVSVLTRASDVGVAAAYARTLMYYAAATGHAQARTTAKALVDAMYAHAEPRGITVPETRADYNRFDDVWSAGSQQGLFVPAGFSGTMPGGDRIAPGATFLSIRSFYRADPDWPKVQAYLDGGPAPAFSYHRFWAQADVAMAFADYARLFPGT